MPIDADQFHRLTNWLWVYFVDKHILGQPALILLGVLLMIAGETAFRPWDQTAMYRLFVRRSTSAKIDIVYYLVQTTGIAALLEIIFSFGIAVAGARLADYTTNQLNWARIALPSDGILQITFSFMVYWIAFGLFGYWIHRLYHSSLFWQVHRFHHAAPELNFITAYRLHPLESFLRVLEFISPMLFLKVPDSAIFMSVVAGNFINFCQHSELPWNWGWIGRWIFGSPLVHQVHHSIDEEHRDTNYGNCPLWDHIFGTWYDGSKKPSGYGIPDLAYEQHPFRQFLHDGWIFYLRMGAWLLQPLRKVRSWTRSPPHNDTALAGGVASASSATERIGA
jgi:sterol desaturase/sphingolipid hydroxylase (fatty acid hydroxylase superfamily)